MELPTFAQAVTAAHQERVATNGGRIGSDTDLPMLQTDANQLRQYFSDPEVGGYAPGVPTPAAPPPPCGLAVPNQGSNPGLMRDCMTLLASKDTLRGAGALNWDVGTAITSWDGVTVEGAPQHVARLKLTNKSLTGSIPERLADLDALVELKLSGNSLAGCIPLPLKDVATNDLSSLNLLYCQPPAPGYLEEEIPACTPLPGSDVDPCEPRTIGNGMPKSDGLLLYEIPLEVEHLFNGAPTTPMYTTHVAARGTYLPGTVRCTSGHRHRYPAYSGSGTLVDALVIYCFADVRVNAYLLGSGPSTLTVIVRSSLYALKGDDDEDYGLEQLESRRVAYERALAEGGQFGYDEPLEGYLLPGGGSGPVRLEYPREGPVVIGPIGGIGGKEAVLFIGPSYSLSVEAWRVLSTWDMERQEDDTVVVLHPFRQWLTTEEYSSVGEMELPAITQAVTAAHQERVATNGGRIGADTDLPMLQTDANQLRQYFSDPKVGGYAPGVPTPAQPPPPCGLAVPNQGSNPGLMRDCMTLLASNDTLRGTGALNWDVGTTITSWNGVTVEGAPQRIARLKLTNKSLTGSIPERLADLNALVELKLSGNSLTGCIPLSLKDVATNDLSSLNLLYCQPPAPENLTGLLPRRGAMPRLLYRIIHEGNPFLQFLPARDPTPHPLASPSCHSKRSEVEECRLHYGHL